MPDDRKNTKIVGVAAAAAGGIDSGVQEEVASLFLDERSNSSNGTVSGYRLVRVADDDDLIDMVVARSSSFLDRHRRLQG